MVDTTKSDTKHSLPSAPVVIAECCQNHNGDRSILKEMIHAAREAGATCIKIQSILSKELTYREKFEEGKISPDGRVEVIKRPYAPEKARLSKLDLTLDDQAWFVEECNRIGIEPLTTIFTRSDIARIASLGWRTVKVASYDCASLPLLSELKRYFIHLYVSTGATYDHEIEAAAQLLKGHSFSFLHCVTLYPTPLNQLHLNRMNWLRKFTPHVGFSDHSRVSQDGLKACFAALAQGAQVVERHFTVLDETSTKDGPVSITPTQLRELVEFSKLKASDQMLYVKQNIPEFNSMLGQETRNLSHEELLNRDYYRGRFATQRAGKVLWNWINEEEPYASSPTVEMPEKSI